MRPFPLASSLVVLWSLIGCRSAQPVGRGPQSPVVSVFAASAARLDPIQFDERVYPLLDGYCNSCHQNPATSFEEAVKFVSLGAPEKSVLYRAAMGRSHREVWPQGSDELAVLEGWIRGQ